MISPQEIDRLRDLRSADTDAHIDLCRPRVLVVAKAAFGEYTNNGAPETVLSYQFSDGQGYSGLQRGDIVRGTVFGTYASDTSGSDTDTTIAVLLNGSTAASILVTRADLAGDIIAFHCDFMLRFDGGENLTINSPAKSSVTVARCLMRMQFGDLSTSTWSRSQAVQDSWITATDTLGTAVNLAAPLNLKLTYEGITGGRLTIYGGTLEGM